MHGLTLSPFSMEWNSLLSAEAKRLITCEDFRKEGLDKFPANDIRLWFDPSALPNTSPAIAGIKVGDTIQTNGAIDHDSDPVLTAFDLYNRAGKAVSLRGDFSVSWTLSHADWSQKKGYEESMSVGVIWGRTGCPPGLSFRYQPSPGSRVYADPDYAVVLFNEMTSAAHIPLASKKEGGGIRVETTAYCDFPSGFLKTPFDGLRGRGFSGDYIEMVRGVKSVLDEHGIQIVGTHWWLTPFIEPLPNRVPEDPPDVMAEKFLKTICGADLPADRYEVQAHFSFTSVQGLEFVRAFCGPKNEFLFPLVELTPEKSVKVLVSIGVKPEGYCLQLASRKELKPEFLAGLEARFDTTFQPLPKPDKTSKRKK